MKKKYNLFGFMVVATALLAISCNPPTSEPTPPPGNNTNFKLSIVSQSGDTINQAQLIESTDTILKVKVTPENGFSSEVKLQADTLPEGVTVAFDKTVVKDEAVLVLTAKQGIQAQNSTIKIRGTADTLTQDASLELTIALPSNQTGYAPDSEGEEKSITINGKELKYEVIDGLAIYQGDMILGTAEEIATLPNQPNGITPQGVSCDELLKYCEKWPDGQIPYSFADNWGSTNNNQVMRREISAAIAEWENKTVLRFIPATSGDRLNFTNSKGCSSEVGFSDDFIGSNVQDVNLSLGCGKIAIIHEIGHAIGLHHEQSRSDRNEHVKIFYENIIESEKDNFDIADDAMFLSATDIGEYDYDSIMHYGQYAFSKNGQPTIETIPAGIPIGQASGLSEGDVQAAYYLYRPNFSIVGPSGVVLQVDKALTYTLDFPVKPVADQYIQWGNSQQPGIIGTGKTLSLNAKNLPLGINTLTARIVIKGMTLAERSIQLKVEEVLGNVAVGLHSITVHDDHDGFGKGAGEVWLDYIIGGIKGRWPDNGEASIQSGSTREINKIISLTLKQSENLNIFVNGVESDSDSADDNMGEVKVAFSGTSNWGEGWHHIKSSNGSYTLHFYVTLNGAPPPIE